MKIHIIMQSMMNMINKTPTMARQIKTMKHAIETMKHIMRQTILKNRIVETTKHTTIRQIISIEMMTNTARQMIMIIAEIGIYKMIHIDKCIDK